VAVVEIRVAVVEVLGGGEGAGVVARPLGPPQPDRDRQAVTPTTVRWKAMRDVGHSTLSRPAAQPLLLCRFTVGTCEDNRVAIGIAKPDLAVRRPAGLSLGRIAVRGQNDLVFKLAEPLHGGVEVIDLEPE
jgi:hypothetical protein